MSTITLPNIRVGSDLQVRVRLKDGGMAIDWSTLNNVKAYIYSDAQRAMAGRCSVSVDEEDTTLLVCNYAASKPQYLGANRIVIQARYLGETKTYDKPAFTFVRWTDDQEGEEITIEDPDVDVEINVEDVSSSILQEVLEACIRATEEAREVVDVGRGPRGYSAYQIAVQDGFEGTEEEWLESLQGEDGQPGPQGIQGVQGPVGPAGVTSAVVTVDNTTGTPSATASVNDGLLSIAITGIKGAKGDKGDTGEQGAKGDKGDTGEQGPQGVQGNPGSSQDYPFELVNNETTDDSTKAHTAAGAKRLKDELSQLEAEVDEKIGKVTIPVAESGKAIYLNGGVGSTIGAPVTSSYSYSRYPVTPGNIVIVNGNGGGSPRLWGFVDANGVILSVADASVAEKDLWLTVPANSAEVIINTNDLSVPCYYYDKGSVEYELDEFEGRVEGIPLPMRYNNAINLSGGVGTTVPAPAVVAGWGYFDHPCDKGSRLLLSGSGGTYGLWAFVDAENKILSWSGANEQADNLTVVAPENAVRVVGNIYNYQSRPAPILSLYDSVNARLSRLEEGGGEEGDEQNILTNSVDAEYKAEEFSSEECSVSKVGTTLEMSSQSGVNPKLISTFKGVAGHKYYFRIYATVNNGNCTKFDIGFPSNYISYNTPTENVETKVAGIASHPSGSYFYFITRYADVLSSRTTSINLQKGIIIIDLTSTFGEGKEPSVELVESMITSIDHYHIGTIKQTALDNANKTDGIVPLYDKLHLLPLAKKAELIKFAKSAGPYAGKYEPGIRNPNLFYNGVDVVSDSATLASRQAEIVTKWGNMMGQLPAFDTEQEFVLVSSEPRNGYIFNRVKFEYLPGRETTAYLLVPYDDIQDGRLSNGKRPGILAPYYEPDTPSGIGHADGYFGIFALEAVKRGYIALAFGLTPQNPGFYYPSVESPTVQPLYICVSWVVNALNCLEKVAGIDTQRIGIIGNSFGGKFALMGAAFDNRIKCGVFGDYGCTFSRSNYEDTWYLGLPVPGHADGAYVDMVSENMDISELLVLLCPRKFMLSTGIYDRENSWMVLNYIVDTYSAVGETGCVLLTTRDQHQFTLESLQQAFWFFDTNFKEF